MCGVSPGMVTPTPKEFNKGLFFIKDTDILLSGDKWTIAVNIALDYYSDLINSMKTMIKQLQQKIRNQNHVWTSSSNIYWGEVDRLDRVVRELEDDRDFQKLLLQEPAGRRSKRGLINVLGSELKYLFGTADAKDVERLAKACDELHSRERTTHASEQQLTYIRALDETTKQNTKDTFELARIFRDSIRNVSLQNKN
jgi:hypothetical protein